MASQNSIENEYLDRFFFFNNFCYRILIEIDLDLLSDRVLHKLHYCSIVNRGVFFFFFFFFFVFFVFFFFKLKIGH